MKATIIGTGSYIPEYILTNQELSTMVETDDEWIVTRTGISERRIQKSGDVADMAVNAALKAFKSSFKYALATFISAPYFFSVDATSKVVDEAR